MKLKFIFASILLTFIVFFGYESNGAAMERTYTNSDLSNYKGENGGTVIGDKPLKEAPEKKGASKEKDQKSQQYWCSKGTAFRSKIDKAKAKVEEAEDNLVKSENSNSNGKRSKDYKKKHSAAEKKLRNAKKELYSSEKELDQFEQNAHMQNVPPGWLRCQFHY